MSAAKTKKPRRVECRGVPVMPRLRRSPDPNVLRAIAYPIMKPVLLVIHAQQADRKLRPPYPGRRRLAHYYASRRAALISKSTSFRLSRNRPTTLLQVRTCRILQNEPSRGCPWDGRASWLVLALHVCGEAAQAGPALPVTGLMQDLDGCYVGVACAFDE